MKKRDVFFLILVLVSFIIGFLISKFIFSLNNVNSFFSGNLTGLFVSIYLIIKFFKEDWKNL